MKTLIQTFTVLAIKVIVAHSIYCGHQYVSRGHLCCKPIFNCKAGHEIVQCTQMYAEERCQACPDGHFQPDHISSLDTSRSCFVKQDECTAYDITYSTPRKNCYPEHCKCNVDKCFIDDHCVCVKVRGCPVNQTLDPSTRGHEIVQCTQMYAEERCQACPGGHVQPDHISSLDTSRSCFVKQDECTAHDITYSTPHKNCYPKHCKCNVDKCFIDDHCVCVKVRGCPVNQTLDPSTRECKPCPRFSYKDQIGCGPCIMDTEAWRVDKQLQDDIGYNQNTRRSIQTREETDCQIKLKRAERRLAKMKRKLQKQKRQISRLQRKMKRIDRIRSSIILSNTTRVLIHGNA